MANGEVWLSLDTNGLWRSTASGASFTEILSPLGARITATSIGFGLQASGFRGARMRVDCIS